MRKADLVIAGVALALLIAIAALRTASQAPPSVPSTFDTGLQGYAALYDLLRAERIAVDRFEDPLSALPPRGDALVIAGKGAFDRAASPRGAAQALDRWVRSGGTLVIADPLAASDALALPQTRGSASNAAVTWCGYAGAKQLSVAIPQTPAYAALCKPQRKTLLLAGKRAIAIAYRRGSGTIVALAAPEIFDNAHLAQRDNAAFAVALFSPGARVLFDERIYGYAAGRSFSEVLTWPVRVAITIALVALLLAIAGANLPFAPTIPAEPPDERDTSAYIASLARMLERGGAANDIIRRLAAYATGVLRSRAPGDPQAALLETELIQLQISSAPRASRLLRAGRIFARVRKDFT